MNKSRYIVLIILFLLAGILFWQLLSSNSYIDEANKNMDMGGFKLLIKEDSVKSLLNEKFSPTGGFGCKPYASRSDGIEVVFSGFPDVLDEYKLTGIAATDLRYHFYGIRVGDNIEKAVDILTQNGFDRQDANDSKEAKNFKKRKLNVSLTANNESKVVKIGIRLESTNKKKVVF